jgi:hypothetical protein
MDLVATKALEEAKAAPIGAAEECGGEIPPFFVCLFHI